MPGRIQLDSLDIEPGQCVVICGPNGSGKSSLLRLLCGLEREFTGTVEIGGSDIRKLNRRDTARLISWLPQRPSLSQLITCEAIVAAARFRFLESPPKARVEAIRILREQGIEHLVGRPAQRVSGGELQRVLIASLVAQDAPFLLVDEPANHLDPYHQVATYSRLGRLWREEGRAVVVVTHDVRLAQALGPAEDVRVLGINEGRLLPETTLASPELPELLEELYRMRFVRPGQPGSLAVELERGMDS